MKMVDPNEYPSYVDDEQKRTPPVRKDKEACRILKTTFDIKNHYSILLKPLVYRREDLSKLTVTIKLNS